MVHTISFSEFLSFDVFIHAIMSQVIPIIILVTNFYFFRWYSDVSYINTYAINLYSFIGTIVWSAYYLHEDQIFSNIRIIIKDSVIYNNDFNYNIDVAYQKIRLILLDSRMSSLIYKPDTFIDNSLIEYEKYLANLNIKKHTYNQSIVRGAFKSLLERIQPSRSEKIIPLLRILVYLTFASSVTSVTIEENHFDWFWLVMSTTTSFIMFSFVRYIDITIHPLKIASFQ